MVEDSKIRQADLELRLAQASALATLLQHVGFALWQLAECEDSVAHYVVLRVRGARAIGRERGEKLLANAQRRTFGSLLAELRDAGVIEGALESRLQLLLAERNWLVHHSKRESRGALNDVAQYDSLVQRLARLADDALELQKVVAAEMEEFVVQSGVDRAEIDRESERLARSWGW